MALRRLLLVLCFAIAGVPAASAAPQSGWWWNPNESGRGFFIEIVDGFAYIGAYVYAPDGRADWVVSQGAMTTPMSYSGRLLTFRGGQSLDSDYRPPGPAIDAGAISVQFTGDRTATLSWPGGTMPIERLAFDNGPGQPIPRTGWWWNEKESGVGYSIEVQGSTLFVVGFMYDDAGNAVWYYSAGPMASPTSFTAPMYRFANGQAMGAPYRAPGPPVSVGTMTLEFFAPDEAELTLSEAGGVTFKKRPRKGKQKPTLPAPKISLPPEWKGTFTSDLKFDIATGGFTGHEQIIVELDGRFVEGIGSLPGSPGPKDVSYDFAGTVNITYHRHASHAALGSCSYSLIHSQAAPKGSTLVASEDASYELHIFVALDNFEASGICAVGVQAFPSKTIFHAHVNTIRKGVVSSNAVAGFPPAAPSGSGKQKVWWSFVGTL
jgi:hypothetical protein